jgi:hypothetical protein
MLRSLSSKGVALRKPVVIVTGCNIVATGVTEMVRASRRGWDGAGGRAGTSRWVRSAKRKSDPWVVGFR